MASSMGKDVYAGKRIFKQIFKDWWPVYEKACKARKVEREVVGKAMKCGDPEMGFVQYLCPKCGETKKIPFSCHSRFCISCARLHLEEWVEKMKGRMFKKVSHRHIILTTPRELWGYFKKDRKLLKVLADAGSELMKDILGFYRKKKGIEPGIICVPQTSGRALNFNPHLHLLMTEGGLGKGNVWYQLSGIDGGLLGKKWQYFLLTRLKEHLPKTRKISKLIDTLFKEKKGFITHAKKEEKRETDIVNYLIKYVASPPISLRRILRYDGKNVTYCYCTREGNQRQEETVSALAFISFLVQHIPEKGQKMVRYYGLYARNKIGKMGTLIAESIRMLNQSGWEEETETQITEVLSPPLSYRQRMIKYFNKDPTECPKCGAEMIVEKIVGAGGIVIYDLRDERFQKEVKEPVDVEVFKEDKKPVGSNQLLLSPLWV